MNIVLLEEADFVASDQVRLCGRRALHVAEVHGAAAGRQLCVGRVNGRIGSGVVTDVAEGRIAMRVVLDQDPPAPLAVRLILALPRPKSLRRILQGVTAMGVKDITVLNTWRVEKSYWGTPLLAEPALRRELILGLEQGRDTRLPLIRQRRLFKPFVEDELPSMSRNSRCLVAHPHATTRCPEPSAEPTTLVIGPEGGLIPYEIDMLEARGFAAVSLGAHIMRVEQAVPALIARLCCP
jgi:RsmE family RNA methyltransferase